MPKSTLQHTLSGLFKQPPEETMVQALMPLYEKYRHLKGQNVIVLFSGGLDTSFITHFLTHVIGANVTTLFVDVGSVTEPANMQEVATRSKEMGALNHQMIDNKAKLAELGMQAVMAEAQLGNGHGHHPASSLSRIAICESAISYAKENKVTALFHGSNGSQNNPFRYRAALKYFQDIENYAIEECTPNLGKTAVSREMQQRYLQAAGISLKSTTFEENVSHDRNLLGDEWEEARIANPNNTFDVRKVAFKNGIKQEPTTIKIFFAQGIPTSVAVGDAPATTDPVQIFERLNSLGKEYHLGIYDYPEGRPIGVRAREIHIAPAMHMLVKAHNWLRAYQLDTDTNFKLGLLSQYWSHEVMEENRWTGNKREKMDGLFADFNKVINGTVTLAIEHGQVTTITSPDAAMHMEGTKDPATPNFISQYTNDVTPSTTSKPRTSPQMRVLDAFLRSGAVASR